MSLSRGGEFLYVLNANDPSKEAGDGKLIAYRVDSADGSLTKIQEVEVEPKPAFGVVAL